MSRGGNGDLSGGAANGNKEYFVDTKLVFRLKQFVAEQGSARGPLTEDAALGYLLDKYKEYVRKPQVRTLGGVGDSRERARGTCRDGLSPVVVAFMGCMLHCLLMGGFCAPSAEVCSSLWRGD